MVKTGITCNHFVTITPMEYATISIDSALSFLQQKIKYIRERI